VSRRWLHWAGHPGSGRELERLGLILSNGRAGWDEKKPRGPLVPVGPGDRRALPGWLLGYQGPYSGGTLVGGQTGGGKPPGLGWKPQGTGPARGPQRVPALIPGGPNWLGPLDWGHYLKLTQASPWRSIASAWLAPAGLLTLVLAWARAYRRHWVSTGFFPMVLGLGATGQLGFETCATGSGIQGPSFWTPGKRLHLGDTPGPKEGTSPGYGPGSLGNLGRNP